MTFIHSDSPSDRADLGHTASQNEDDPPPHAYACVHTILVVEDDASLAKTVSMRLRALGMHVVHATSLEEVETIAPLGHFCLVLLDLNILPTPDEGPPHAEFGVQALRTIVHLYPRCHAETGARYLPVVVMSGESKDHAAVREAYQCGAVDFLEKPFARLGDDLRAVLARSGREDHAACAECLREARRRPASIPPPRGEDEATIAIEVTGERDGDRNRVLVNGTPALVSNWTLTILLGLSVARARGETYRHFTELGGSGLAFKPAADVKRDLRPYVGEEEILLNDRKGGYALASHVTLRVSGATLRKHDNARVRAFAEELGQLVR